MLTIKIIDELRTSIGGNIALPSDAAYNQAITIDNGRIVRHPACIVFPINAYDIAVTLKWIKRHHTAFTVRGGGHSATGYCLNNDHVVIDMSQMIALHLDVDKQTLRMQTGLTWLAVYEFLNASGTGLIPVGGACSTVGVGGFMLGGGISFVSRSFGMAIDNLLGLTIVTANGDIKKLYRDSPMSPEDEDLFWACQGGGGGNFGVVVEMEVALHKTVTPTIFCGSFSYSLAQINEVLKFYNKWILTVPDTLAVYGYLGMTPPSAGQQIESLCLTAVFNGSYEEGFKLVAPLMAMNPVYVTTYDTTLINYELQNGTFTSVENRDAYIRSAVFNPGSLTDDVATIFKRYMQNTPSNESFATWMHTGGRIKDKLPSQTAYPHREAEFVFQLKTIWSEPSAALKNIAWGYQFVEELMEHANGGYVNYIDPLLHGWKEKYYGKNIDRLLKVKKQADPDNLFYFQQSVNADFDPPTLDFSQPETVDLSPLNRSLLR